MTKLKDIPKSLESHLATMVGLPEVAWPNIDFDFEVDKLYVRPQVAISRTTPIGVGDDDGDLLQGMYQVDVFSPKGEGVRRGLDLAQNIADHFPKGLELSTSDGIVRMSNSDIQSGGNVGSHFQIILSIYYTSVVSQ
jgi:Bacteriophage related domain of unknown function